MADEIPHMLTMLYNSSYPFILLTHFMRDTLLGVPLGKQFGSQIRPHIVGPDPRSNLLTTGSTFYQKLLKTFQNFEFFPAADVILKWPPNIIQHIMG